MENYIKDATIELDDNCVPFDGIQYKTDVIQMQVKRGTKIKNIIDYSIRHFIDKHDERQIVMNGSAEASYKAISCAEILKRKYFNRNKLDLYQITKIGYKSIEEYWKPIDHNLDVLKVIRKIPTIHILLSKDSLNESEPGFQYKNPILANQSTHRQELNRNKRSFKSKQKNISSKNNTLVSNERKEDTVEHKS